MYQNVIKSVEKRKMLEDQYSEALKFKTKSNRRICSYPPFKKFVVKL